MQRLRLLEVLSEELDLTALDPGIRETVRWLRSHGFETTDSGDGVSKDLSNEDVLPFPHVAMMVPPDELVAEADRLAALLREAGHDIQPQGPEGTTAPAIQASYDPANGIGMIVLTHLQL